MIYNGDCAQVLKTLDSNSVDLTVTSPPYDDLRSYDGNYKFDLDTIITELLRVTKDGGIVVWVVGDKRENFDKSGTSFRHALRFKDLGWKLLDTMIYAKTGATFKSDKDVGYHSMFEYMFVFSKGRPKTFNGIKDIPVKHVGAIWHSHTRDPKTGKLNYKKPIVSTNTHRLRGNIWEYSVGTGVSEDKETYKHPAVFPEGLVIDHITTWSNEGDTVLDPFMGSGTTYKIAYNMNRKPIGIEINPNYIEIANKRLEHHIKQEKLF